ncbi:MAG: T9SS type A sorting domain-containing protein [bacterium]
MKKIIFISSMIMIFTGVFAIDYHLMRDDSTGNHWYWYEQNNNTIHYWAVQYYTSDTCTLRTVDWGRWTKQNRTYTDSIFVCFDNGTGSPAMDSLIYTGSETVSTGGVSEILRHTVSGSPLAVGDFWIVIKTETQNNNSYFLSDTLGSGNSYVSGDGITWNELTDGVDTADLIIRSWVSGPEGMSLLINEKRFITEEQFIENLRYNRIISSRFNVNLTLSSISDIEISIMDRTGRILKCLVDDYKGPGDYLFTWDASNYPAGVYFMKIRNNLEQDMVKLIKMK